MTERARPPSLLRFSAEQMLSLFDGEVVWRVPSAARAHQGEEGGGRHQRGGSHLSREGCQNSDSRFEPRFWRPLLCCNLTRAVRARAVRSRLTFLRFTRAREIPETAERRSREPP